MTLNNDTMTAEEVKAHPCLCRFSADQNHPVNECGYHAHRRAESDALLADHARLTARVAELEGVISTHADEGDEEFTPAQQVIRLRASRDYWQHAAREQLAAEQAVAGRLREALERIGRLSPHPVIRELAKVALALAPPVVAPATAGDAIRPCACGCHKLTYGPPGVFITEHEPHSAATPPAAGGEGFPRYFRGGRASTYFRLDSPDSGAWVHDDGTEIASTLTLERCQFFVDMGETEEITPAQAAALLAQAKGDHPAGAGGGK